MMRENARPGSVNRRGRCLRVLGSLLLLATLASPTRAALIVFAPSFSAVQGSSGSFDLLIGDTDPAGTIAIKVAGLSVKLSVTGAAGITFTNVTINTTVDPYIFADSLSLPGPLSFDAFPNISFTTSDADNIPSQFRSLSPGDFFGVAHVSYTVAANATVGSRSLTIAQISASDNLGGDVATTASNGVFGVTAAPEPGALSVLSLAGVGLLKRRRRD